MPPISKKWQAKLMAATALNNDIHTLYQYSHKYHRCQQTQIKFLKKKKKMFDQFSYEPNTRGLIP